MSLSEKDDMEQPQDDYQTISIGGVKDSRVSLKIADHKFVIGKEEFYPFVAEMHYHRIPKRHWSVCFERIRRAEFRIISTTVPWNLHETKQGEFDFEGMFDPTKDLIVFLELCREFGFRIILKLGPCLAAEDRGGLPEFAARHPENMAVDPQGQPLQSDPGGGAQPGPVLSYLSGRVQILLKNYYTSFLQKVKNYVYPRGPVFMIELDHETSFGGHFYPFSGDYNPQGSLAAFPRFLEEKYGTLDKLNKAYHLRVKDFSEVPPLTGFEAKTPADYRKPLDWVEFREWVVNRYAESLSEFLLQSGVSVLFSRSLAFRGAYHFPDVAGAHGGGRVIFTVNLGWDVPFAETVRRAHSVAGWQSTGYSSQFSIGNRHADPASGHAFYPVSAADSKRLLIAALAGGIRGFDFHMFVGRNDWYDAAVESDGAVMPSYEVVRDAYAHLLRMKYDQMKDFAGVALVQYRPYLRLVNLAPEGIPNPVIGPYSYLTDLMGAGFSDIADDLGSLGHDYRIMELGASERLGEYKVVFVPVGEFMDAPDQDRLLELARNGAHLVLFGLLPNLNTNFEACEILANGIGIKTASDPGIVSVETQKQVFTVNALGVIKRAPNRAVKLAKVGTKLYGASVKCGKGITTVLTFAPGSRLLPTKLAFMQELLALGKLVSPVFSSDPMVHVAVHAHSNGALLMVYETTDTVGSGVQSHAAVTRPVIIGLDTVAVGLAARHLTMTDVLGAETINISPKDLKAGVEIRLSPGGSRLFTIEKKS